MKNKNKILIGIGLFLVVDGLLSVYYGNSCLNTCLNNNDFGNFVRYLRAGLGVILIYFALKKRS